MEASFFLIGVTQNGNNALLYSMQANDGVAGEIWVDVTQVDRR